MKYQEYIYRCYEETFGVKKPFPVEYLIGVVNYLDGKIDELLLDNFVEALVSKENLLDMQKGGSYLNIKSKNASAHMWNLEIVLSTFDNLRITSEELNDMVSFAIDNKDKANMIDNMVRYLVINYNQALSYVSEMKDLKEDEDFEIHVGIKLGNIPLCSCTLALSESMFPDITDSIVFDDLFTRPSLRGLKIGERLFKEIYKEIIKEFPDRSLFACRLMAKNKGGQKFYKKLGGTFFNLEDSSEAIDDSLLDENSEGDIQQAETPVEEKSVTEEEQQQEEPPIVGEPVVAEEQRQEEQSNIEEPLN